MDLKLPKLGEGADSGIVVNVFVNEGDKITKDQAVIELENEKAVASIPATEGGTVTKVYVKAGDKLSVGQRILSLEGGGSEETAKPDGPKTTAKPKDKGDKPEPEAEKEEEEAATDGKEKEEGAD